MPIWTSFFLLTLEFQWSLNKAELAAGFKRVVLGRERVAHRRRFVISSCDIFMHQAFEP